MYTEFVENRIPTRFRLRLLFVYARLVWLYNLAISVFGGAALLAVRAAGLIGAADVSPGNTSVTGPDGVGAGIAATVAESGLASPESVLAITNAGAFLGVIAGLLFATAGHWIAVVVASTVHRSERELYRAGGWRIPELALASWAGSALLGVALVLMVSP